MAVEYTFNASVETVFALLSDADFLVDRCLAQGEISAECTVEDDSEQLVIAMTRVVERALPPVLARLLDTRQTLEHVERWRQSKDGRRGSLSIKLRGHAINVEAELRLRPDSNGGCTYSVSHVVEANMPLIGRRVESHLMTQMETSAHSELAYLDTMLRR